MEVGESGSRKALEKEDVEAHRGPRDLEVLRSVAKKDAQLPQGPSHRSCFQMPSEVHISFCQSVFYRKGPFPPIRAVH